MAIVRYHHWTMPRRFAAALLLAALGPSCATSGSPASGAPPPPSARLPADARPLAYRLEITVDPEGEGFRGQVEIDVALRRSADRIWLNGRSLSVEKASIRAGGALLSATYEQVTPQGVARIVPERPIPAGKATLLLAYSAPWGEGAGLFRSRRAGRAYAATLHEPADARRTLPCFDEPGFKVPFEVALRVPRGLVAVSNGPAVAQEPAGDGWTRVRFAPTPPLPTYLLFLAAGPFDVLDGPALPPSALRPHPLPLRMLAPAGERDRAAQALEATRTLLPWMERWFGIGFPYAKLDQLAMPGHPTGGMENAGAIAYAEGILLADATTPQGQRMAMVRLVAHEVAHQWFGDLVTLPWWDDTWLNESFATFLTVKSVDAAFPEQRPLAVAQAELGRLMEDDALASSRAVRQPVIAVEDAESQFDDLSYDKGAAVLRMVERWAGEERFRAAVRAWIGAHAHGIGTTDALLASLSREAERDVGAVMRGFLDRPGVPHVDARVACGEGGARLELVQERWLPIGSRASANVQWQLPLCVRYGIAGEARESCALVAGPHGAVPLAGCPDWLLPDAGGTGYWLWSLAPEDLERLRARGLARLDPGERISYARSLAAGARSGHLPYGEALASLAPLGRDPDVHVAGSPMALLSAALEGELLPRELASRARARAAALYRPVADGLGWAPAPGEAEERGAFRARVFGFLGLTARDPAVLRAAAEKGRAYAALDQGRFRPEAVSPDLATLALAAAAADPATFEALEKRLHETDDPALRRRLLAGLGAATAPPLSERALALVAEPRLRPGERTRLIAMQVVQTETRAAAFAALQRHFDLLVREGAFTAAWLPTLASGFCDRERAGEVRAFFAPRASALPGGGRLVDQAVERIELCAALREAQGASAAAWFTAR